MDVKFYMAIIFEEPQEEVIEIWGKSGPNYQQEAIDKLRYLWKLDDPAWVEKRSSDWDLIKKHVFPDTPKKERKVYEEYFKSGVRREYIGGLTTMMLTPYTSESEFKKVLTSRLIGNDDRKRIYTSYIYMMTEYRVCDWYQEHMRIARETLLGDQYKIVKEEGYPGDYRVISPRPSYWVSKFIMKSIKNIKGNVSYSPIYHCLNYFISILEHAIDDRNENLEDLERLFSLVEKKLDSEELSGAAQAFAKEITEKKALILEAWEIGEQRIAAEMQVAQE